MKPMRPFPFPLNIGTDICQISRIYRVLSSPRGTRFVKRILAPEEHAVEDVRLNVLTRTPGLSDNSRPLEATIATAMRQGQQAHEALAALDHEMWKCAAFVAGRFAAKEAVIKAHSHRRLTFHDVVIERRAVEGERLGSGPPVARIKSAEDGAEADESAMISISHDGDYATAVCLGHDPGASRSDRV
ncbi:hypothetical protein B0J13DRAFT_329482 [Dactylonectria estremocensis]|uniref:4'-phosphopantetheinyl transferase domain-containing protein n=1 Tax=Dactylonectria estremocensis TaxID=1079267 RepID=A0A9P9ERU9_9HYPO|nr:hypothetical protein B0J13DRAFT_329482 [Dactylonectria estremocensis]